MTSREKTREAVQKCLAVRGYVVIAIKNGAPTRYKIGEILHVCCAEMLNQPFMVVSETNCHDWLEQCQIVGATNMRTDGEAFYRVTTD